MNQTENENLDLTEEKDEKNKQKWNMVGSFICLLFFLALGLTEFFQIKRWCFEGEHAIYSFICLAAYSSFVLAAWVIRKYKLSFRQYMTTILVTSVFCAVVMYFSHNMNLYILQKHISYDIQYLNGSASYLRELFVEWDYNSADEASQATYQDLLSGVMITNWDEPENELQKAIADKLHISSFEQYRYHFYTNKGQAMVFLKIVDDSIYMRLVNPTQPVNQTIDVWYPLDVKK